MSVSPPAGSEISEDFSHYSGYESESSVRSTMAELLERFTVDAQPECTLKLRSKYGPVVVGADLTRITGAKANVGALVLKPSHDDQLWRRLRIDNAGTLTLRSRKLQWWVFTLDLIGHANPLSRTFDLSYRVATKWDVAKGEYRNKKRFEVSPKAEARAHWSISYSLPAIEGSMGTAARRVSREVCADVGYAHLDIPRVELVVWPRGRPAKAAAGPAGEWEEEGQWQAGGADAAGATAAAVAAAAGEEGSYGGGGGVGVYVAEPSLAGEGSRRSGGGTGGWGSGGVPAQAALGPLAAAATAAVPAGGQPPREYLPDYLRTAGSAGTAGAAPTSSGDGSGGGGGHGSERQQQQQRREASLRQLNSHVASISGRWWDMNGSSSSRCRQRRLL